MAVGHYGSRQFYLFCEDNSRWLINKWFAVLISQQLMKTAKESVDEILFALVMAMLRK